MDDDDEPEPPEPGITSSEHARLRALQGRPTGLVHQDIQHAGPNDVFVQPEDGRFVVRGANAREHILEPDGKHVTSIRPRTASAHRARLRSGTIRPATEEEYDRLKRFAG